MRKPLKIIFSTLASLVLLAIVTVVTVPFMVDVNDFKAQIEAVVQTHTGRTLTIEGDLELSVFPWLGISTGKMTLNNADGFSSQPFAQINESQMKVKLWPLLFKQVEVSEIVLKGLSLNLSKNSQGLSNWDDLAALINNDKQAKNPLKLLEIAGLLIENSQISWDDQQADNKINIKDFHLTTDKLIFNQPIEIAFAFSAHHSQLALTEHLDFEGEVMINEELDVFSLKQIKLQTRTEGESIPTGKLLATVLADAHVDLKQHKVKFAPVTVKTGELSISSQVLTAELESPYKVQGFIHIPNFDAAEFIKQHKLLELPVMVDEKALTWLAADFQLHADVNQAKLQNLEIQLDETTLKGLAGISNFSDPAINFDLALDKLNLDRYLPPPTESTSQDLQNSPASAIAENATLIPVEMLRSLNLNGRLSIADLKVKNLTMQGVRFIINAKQGVMQSLQSVNRLYQGAYNSKVVLDVSRDLPDLSLNEQLSHIQIEPLLTDLQGQPSRLAGLIDLNAKLEASGHTDTALKSSLNGRLSFAAEDMLIRGFNLQKLIDNGKILLSSAELATENKKELTAFSKVTGTAIISNGFLLNNDLSASAAKTKVNGMGVINLVSQQLDYKIIAHLLKEKLTTTHAKVVNNLPVFINIGGTFDAPAYQVDLAAMGVGL